MKFDKEQIRASLLVKLREQLDVLRKSTAVASDATTHADARSEGKYDTRAIEAGYLAGAQAGRLKEVEGKIQLLEKMVLKDLSGTDKVAPTALVDCGMVVYFVLPHLGGFELEQQGKKLVTVTPESKLGQNLLECYVGDEVNDLEILSIH